MTHINVMKKVQWEGIQLCAFFDGQEFLVGQVEDLRVGGWFSLRKGGRPGD